MTAVTAFQDLRDALGGFPRRRDQLLPLLHEAHRLQGYVGDDAIAEVARHVYLPRSEVYGIASGYSEFRREPAPAGEVEVCAGLSCLIAGGEEVARSLAGEGYPVRRVACRFACHAAPVIEREGAVLGPVRIGRADTPPAAHLAPDQPAEWRRLTQPHKRRNYEALAKARTLGPQALVQLVRDAGLRGRGGAYFPTAIKWESARAHQSPRYLVVNAEEGEPGVFKDRLLMERSPALVIEGIAIAALAIEAERVYLYINGLAHRAAQAMHAEATRARSAGWLPGIEIEMRRGAAGYVAGEESVLLNSIEGQRPVPRFRPPLPTERGLFGRPTVINNVETLANLPEIVLQGAGWWRTLGTAEYLGTKVLCLSGDCQRPGVYEVPLGTSLRQVLELAGAARAPAVLAGGPSGGLLPPALYEVPLVGGSLHRSGAVLGAGGFVALGAEFPTARAVRELARYNAAESCGWCTPCREGTARMAEMLASTAPDPALLAELADVAATASMCGLGQMAGGPIRSALELFPEAIA